jgi:pre-mRNA-splicing factor ATP-dependent RNA helicase DHX15/PRP43
MTILNNNQVANSISTKKSAKSASKSSAKSVSKSASKSSAKSVSNSSAKSASKSAANSAVKSATKSVANTTRRSNTNKNNNLQENVVRQLSVPKNVVTNIAKSSVKSTGIGILDPEGKHPNPLTGEPYTAEYYKRVAYWDTLPVYKDRVKLLKHLNDYQVTLGVSGTGSGKSVLVPKYVLHNLNYTGKIVMTIPKRTATRKTATFAAETLDVPIGTHIGYQFKGESKKSDDTKILYSTDGTLIAMMRSDPLLSELNCVIIDEAHERTISTDMLLLKLKTVLTARPEFKLIIMSATIDIELFERYFKDYNFKALDLGSVPNKPVKEIFLTKPLNNPQNDYINAGAEIIYNILKTSDSGDILMFIAGKGDGMKACQALSNLSKNDPHIKPFCVILHGGSSHIRNSHINNAKSNEEYALDPELYKSRSNGPFTRRVVMATNMAESSVTVEGLEYVIEGGLANNEGYNPNKRAYSLLKTRITQAAALQRKGRVGRTKPGTCYYLYTKDEFDAFEKYPIPDIRKQDFIEHTLTFFNTLEHKNIKELKLKINSLIEPPSEDILNDAIRTLHALNAISINTNNSKSTLTQLGDKLAHFNMIPITQAKSLIIGYLYGCMDDVADIIAMMNIIDNQMDRLLNPCDEKNLRLPASMDAYKRKQEISDCLKRRAKITHPMGDHLTLWKVYNEYRKYKTAHTPEETTQWFKAYNINKKIMKDIDHTRSDIIRQTLAVVQDLPRQSSPPFSKKEDNILAALLQGHYIHLAQKTGKYYTNCFPPDCTSAPVDNKSTLANSKTSSRFIMYTQLKEVNLNMFRFNIVSKITPSILAKLNDEQNKTIEKCLKTHTKSNNSSKSSKKHNRKVTKKFSHKKRK